MAKRAIVQVNLQRRGALPEDDVINVMHFEGDQQTSLNQTARGEWDGDIPGLLNRLETFYGSIAMYLAKTLSGQVTLRAYDFEDAKPRVPRATRQFSIIPSPNEVLPAEVAWVISMQAAPKAGARPGRRRGRIYLGPLQQGLGGSTATSPDHRPSMAVADTILGHFKTMARGSSASAFKLAIYSPTQGAILGQMDEAWNDVVSASIDNAWDTQRRRGAKATERRSIAI